MPINTLVRVDQTSPHPRPTTSSRVGKTVFWASLSASVLFAGTWANVPSRLPWDDLSPPIQKLLDPLEEHWKALSPERRDRLQHNAQRWLNLPKEDKAQIHERFNYWQELPEERRELIRTMYERYHESTAKKRQHLRRRYQWYQSLPIEQQASLRNQWEQHRTMQSRPAETTEPPSSLASQPKLAPPPAEERPGDKPAEKDSAGIPKPAAKRSDVAPTAPPRSPESSQVRNRSKERMDELSPGWQDIERRLLDPALDEMFSRPQGEPIEPHGAGAISEGNAPGASPGGGSPPRGGPAPGWRGGARR